MIFNLQSDTPITGGLAHLVERSLRMREAQGSIPWTSIFFAASDGCFSPLPGGGAGLTIITKEPIGSVISVLLLNN